MQRNVGHEGQRQVVNLCQVRSHGVDHRRIVVIAAVVIIWGFVELSLKDFCCFEFAAFSLGGMSWLVEGNFFFFDLRVSVAGAL